MNGIIGIVNFDGCPVDAALFDRMMQKMQLWAADRQGRVVEGNTGFGFAQLRTADEAVAEHQPFSLNGSVHIVADARIDERTELIRELRRRGRRIAWDVPDVELILHAYHTWGRGCVDKLVGDFVFAIWDSERERLFCARDHFGVKPLFYAEVGNAFVFGNALNVVRLHPEVGDDLNDLAIADFLLFGFNQTANTTSFENIRRLPPAHTLTRTKGGRAVTGRYWSLPVDGVVRYRRQSEYVEHFKELFSVSVADRLRGSRVGVSMSGGLDSTSVASMAHSILSNKNASFDMRLCTNVYDKLIPDKERQFARQVAQTLNIPIHFESLDNARLHTGWDQPGVNLSEPAEMFDAEPATDARREFMANCRVVLTGLGGDPALAASRAYVVNRIRSGELSDFARGLWDCVTTHGRLPSLGIRALVMGRSGETRHGLPMPTWLNPELVTRLDLEARWKEVATRCGARHPVRPEAYAALDRSTWPHCFGVLDPGCNGIPVEYRHPFFDLRLVQFVLAMPRQPWFVRKALLREAMKGMLPDAVRLRPKAVLCGDPAHAVSSNFDRGCRDLLLSAPGLSSFIDRDAVPVHIWDKPALASLEYWANVRAFSLGYWLSYCRPASSTALARGAI
jgi:asparagine synthase (glutamine-hydrolysing)